MAGDGAREHPPGQDPALSAAVWGGAGRGGGDPRAGVPIARLVGWKAPAQPVAEPGAMRGRIQLRDDFDAPLDDLFEALR